MRVRDRGREQNRNRDCECGSDRYCEREHEVDCSMSLNVILIAGFG
jgi:hypothetical protein